MSRYFDKDFFKFAFGFAAIILLSLTILMVMKKYQAEENADPIEPLTNIAQP